MLLRCVVVGACVVVTVLSMAGQRVHPEQSQPRAASKNSHNGGRPAAAFMIVSQLNVPDGVVHVAGQLCPPDMLCCSRGDVTSTCQSISVKGVKNCARVCALHTREFTHRHRCWPATRWWWELDLHAHLAKKDRTLTHTRQDTTLQGGKESTNTHKPTPTRKKTKKQGHFVWAPAQRAANKPGAQINLWRR